MRGDWRIQRPSRAGIGVKSGVVASLLRNINPAAFPILHDFLTTIPSRSSRVSSASHHKAIMIMSSILSGVGSLLILAPFTLANPLPDRVYEAILPRQTITPGGKPCGQNNATNRRCWKNNWNISTDYEVDNPPAFNSPVVSPVQTLPFVGKIVSDLNSTTSTSPMSQRGLDQMV